nr:LCP family protein [Alkalihalobacillus trypoxylicola]
MIVERSRVRKKKKSGKRKVLKLFLTFFVIALLAVGATIAYSVHQLSSAVTSATEPELQRGIKSEKRTEAVNPSKDNFSVLLLGDDSRPGETRARTDAMLVATFNKDDQSIILTSIPRDSYVDIPGKGLDKINHAHARGGLDLTIDTVENFLDIPIDYYGYVKFDGLVQVVDALGGVNVDVPFDFTFNESSTESYNLQFTEGRQRLNGKEALAFARMRKDDPLGDIGRGQRQQQVIEGIIKEAASFSTIFNFEDLVNAVDDNIRTNFSFPNLVALHSYAGSLNEIEKLQVEGENSRINGIYYLQIKEDYLNHLQTRLKQHLELDGHSMNDPNPFEEENDVEAETVNY